MVEVTVTQMQDLSKEKCAQEARCIKSMIQYEQKRHKRLVNRINEIYGNIREAFTNTYEGKHLINQPLLDFEQSFVILKTQIELALPILEQPFDWQEKIVYPLTDKPEDWQEFLEDIRDIKKDLKRTIDQKERCRFLEIIKILDSMERLERFKFPEPVNEQEQRYQTYLQHLYQVIRQGYQSLNTILHRRGIRSILLASGDYPPIEQTKILFREDDETSETIMITQIVEKGYFWKNTILRKAAVVVITKK